MLVQGLNQTIFVNDDDTFCPFPDQYSADPAMCTRINRGRNVCVYGNRLLELCQKFNLRILNGRKIGDSIGNLTCRKYNGSSTVDYFIGSTELFNNVRYMEVHDWLPCLSDHCPVSVCLNTGTRRNLPLDKNYEKEMAPPKVKWDPIKMLVFKDKLRLVGWTNGPMYRSKEGISGFGRTDGRTTRKHNASGA